MLRSPTWAVANRRKIIAQSFHRKLQICNLIMTHVTLLKIVTTNYETPEKLEIINFMCIQDLRSGMTHTDDLMVNKRTFTWSVLCGKETDRIILYPSLFLGSKCLLWMLIVSSVPLPMIYRLSNFP